MLGHDRFEEIIPIYSLGALDGAELRDLKDHLKTGCSMCEALLKENERLASIIPYSVTGPLPAPSVKDRLFERIHRDQEIKEKALSIPSINRFKPIWYGLGGIVAAALLIILFVSNLSLRGRINNQKLELDSLSKQIALQSENIDSLKIELEKSKAELNSLTNLVSSRDEITEFLENPNVVVINLVNFQSDMKTRGRILWDTEKNLAYFYGLNLPQAPTGKTYQLWAIADAKPISIGVFNVDEKGNNLTKLETLPTEGQIQKFAVTLEPAGGVPQPTGQMYLISGS